MTRLYGRAFSNERIEEYVPDVRFERTSVIASISPDGIQAPMMFKGSLNESVFTAYVRDILAPTIEEGDIVFLDNLSVHKVSGALDPIILKGAKVVFLPPYNHDFNPIELAWSKMKSVLRKLKPRCFDELVLFMKEALDAITVSDILAWFRNCGYSFNV